MTRVMLVEDDLLLARQFIFSLSQAGYEVDHAKHSGEAIVKIDENLPDVIILDLLLPVTSGLALLHELQSYQDTADVPIVICSSIVDQMTLDELRPYGVRRLIDKTIMQPQDVVAAVRAVL